MPRRKKEPKQSDLPGGTELTDRQQLFISEYLACWNATEAAKRAGYQGDTNVLGVTGYDNLRNPKIADAISARLAERAMPANEALARLADHARGSMGDFVQVDDEGTPTGFNLGKTAPQHIIKSVSITDKGIRFELYDAQAALVNILKMHGLFVERHEHSWREQLKQHGHDPDELKQHLVAAAVTALRGADGSADERGDGGSTGSA